MSGLMAAWWRIGSLVPLLLGRVVLPIAAVIFGHIGGGAIWMMWERMPLSGLAVVFVLFLGLCRDGDLVLPVERMLRLRGLDTGRTTKVKGRAGEAMVRAGEVRELERLGNNGADEAADFGRSGVHWGVVDARRNFAGVCSRWRPGVLILHRFFIAISRSVVNHDGERVVPLLIPWFGRLEAFLRGVR